MRIGIVNAVLAAGLAGMPAVPDQRMPFSILLLVANLGTMLVRSRDILR